MATTDQQESVQDAPDVSTPATTQQDSTPDQPDDGKGTGNKEAAKYRRQLRDTEAERDTLAGTVDALQRQLVASNLPPTANLNADALYNVGLKPGDFFTDGQLDADKLTTAVKETHEKLGIPMLRLGTAPGSGTGRGGEGDGGRATLADEVRKRRA